MSVRTDADLVRAAQADDVASFEQLYARYVPVVHAILLGRLPRADADDVAQNVFISAYTKLHSLREPAAFAGWIVRSARNAAEDHRRTMSETVELQDAYVTHETQGDRADAARALDAIRALPEAYRETLMMRLVEGMTGPEISARTGLTPGSVRVNLHRGMQLLRRVLGGSTP
ncbi:MAG TPA: sigma-70 family RNA polymerase sigma factor [Thermoanaerobaculia bacterium]|jgi:RNA polymerase sigma-70 factor (ECF subfamily)|nr:sigma-70 family RNA polymerase sigma factor [Thermoanaerobaculia bacterium]